MKIVLCGGGSGGHFYPLIAVVEAIHDACNERKLIEPELYYIGPEAFDPAALHENDIIFLKSPARRIRNNSFSLFAWLGNAVGIVRSMFQLFDIYPDVILSTGGFAAFPTLYAAHLLNIPVVVYDADSVPGRVTLWSAKFARWIGIAQNDAANHFPKKYMPKIARIGHPIRKEIESPAKEGGHEFLKLKDDVPTIFIVGGSQGARKINETVLDALPMLLEKYNIVHQTGIANHTEVSGIASVILKDSPYADRYRSFGLLNVLALRMAAGIAELVISRAGSGTIFEIASWGIPAILIPIPLDVSHDQTENAFTYARGGGAVVIEQHNLSPHILAAEIDRLMQHPETRAKMRENAAAFARRGAARKLADILLETVVSHEPA